MAKINSIGLIGIGSAGSLIANKIYIEYRSNIVIWAIDSNLELLNRIEIKQKIHLNRENIKNIDDVLEREMNYLGKIHETIIVIGLGGETGSLILPPVIQRVKRIKSIPKIVATFPARFEGQKRKSQANMLLKELKRTGVCFDLILIDDYIKKWNKLTVSDFIDQINHIMAEYVKNRIKNLVVKLDSR